MSDSATSGKKSRPENLLFHSRIEICRFLQVLAQEHSPISAEIKNGHPFSSRLIFFNPNTDHFAVAYGAHKLINAMLLDSPKVEFTATDHQGLNFTFEASAPEETVVDGNPAIQFSLPKSLLLHNRREHPRIPIPADVSLRCIADEAGFMPFESHISDISHDGLGCLIYDPDIVLETGTILKGCRIITYSGNAVIADLELRHVATMTLPDGSRVNRGGFVFLQKPAEIAKLIGLFIQDLDKK
jgi:c-di-GMP-binding flagellar brake protein YcgR